MKLPPKKSLLRGLLGGSLLFYALSGVASFLNYAYYPVVSHLVSTSTYGEVQFLISLLTQLSVGYVVLNLLSIIITAKYEIEHERSAALRALNTTAMTVIVVIIIVGSLILSANRSSFGFGSLTPILMLGLSLLANIPFTIAIGRLQGESKFALSGMIAAFASFCELVLSAILVWVGFGTSGAIAGVGGGMLIALVVARIADRYKTSATRASEPKTDEAKPSRSLLDSYVRQIKQLRHERSLAVAALVAIGLLTVLSTADVLVSKLFLTPHEAGQYAAVATIAKTILYAATPIMWLSLPLALAKTEAANAKVRRFILLTVALSVGLAAVVSIRPGLFTKGLLGIDAGQYTRLLPLAAIAMVLFSLAFLLLAIDMCRDKLRQTTFATLTAGVVFGVIFATMHSHNTMRAAIIGQIFAGLTGIMISIVGNILHDK